MALLLGVLAGLTLGLPGPTAASEPDAGRREAPSRQAPSRQAPVDAGAALVEPDAVNDTYEYARTAGSVILHVLLNDTADSLPEITAFTAPALGSVTCDIEVCTYTMPASGSVATFTYTITDEEGQSDTATVTIHFLACPTAMATGIDPGGRVTGQSWVACPHPTSNGTTTIRPLGMLATHDPRILLTSGTVTAAAPPDDYEDDGALWYSTYRGANDVSVLRLDLAAPVGAECLSFDFVFGSEEYPEFVGSAYNDAFIAELDHHTWQVDDDLIVAPNNFATGPGGQLISVNSVFFGSVATPPNGTEYDGTTPALTARTPITPGPHSLYLSVFDASDWAYDSGVFIDNLVIGAADPVQGCDSGVIGGSEAPADFDGNGRTDISVFRPTTGRWYINGVSGSTNFGVTGDIPVPADYDGIGGTDIAVFRPTTGRWYINGIAGSTVFGINGDIPVPGDYDNDGRANVAIFRPSTGRWYIDGIAGSTVFGLNGDIPVPGQYDGDPATDIAVYRPTTGRWYIDGIAGSTVFGLNGDIPVPGDYDANGITDRAVYRPTTGRWYVAGVSGSVLLGVPGDVPVPGNYDADPATDIAVFRPSTGRWFVQGTPGFVAFGLNGDIPLPLPHAIERIVP